MFTFGHWTFMARNRKKFNMSVILNNNSGLLKRITIETEADPKAIARKKQ